MKEQLILFLISLGYAKATAEGIAAELEKDKTDDTTVKKYVEDFKADQKKLILADPNLNEEARKAGYGKAKSEDESFVKKVFGLSSEEMKDKKFEDVVEFANKKVTESAGTDKQKLLEENIKLVNENKDLKETEIPKIRSEVDAKIEAFEMDHYMIGDLDNQEKRKILGKAKAILPSVKLQLEAMGVISQKKKDGIGYELVHKNTKLPVRSDDGSKLLTTDEVIDKALDMAGLKVNSTPAPPDPLKITKEKGSESDKSINHNTGLDAAEAALKEMQGSKKKK